MPARSQQQNLRRLGDERLRTIVAAYTAAFERGDADALVALLAEDATWSMPPLTAWYAGHAAITDFLRRVPLHERWRHRPTTANGQPALGCYTWEDARGMYVARVLDVLTLDADRITAVTAFMDPGLFARFGLPESLPAW